MHTEYYISSLTQYEAGLGFKFKFIRTLTCSVIDLWLGNAALQWQLTRITFLQMSRRTETDGSEEKTHSEKI